MTLFCTACAAQAEALVAHLYTRYLGDLSGGQILRRAVVRAYKLAGAGTTLDARDGVSFYDFPLIGNATKLRRFKDAYRDTLDTLDVCDVDSLVREAVDAFRRNTALLKELDVVVLGAAEAAARHSAPVAPKAPDAAPVCPFLAKQGDMAHFGKHATCPFSGKAASDLRKAKNDRLGADDATRRDGDAAPPKCPFAKFGPKDFALVAVLALAFAFLPHLLAPATGDSL